MDGELSPNGVRLLSRAVAVQLEVFTNIPVLGRRAEVLQEVLAEIHGDTSEIRLADLTEYDRQVLAAYVGNLTSDFSQNMRLAGVDEESVGLAERVIETFIQSLVTPTS